MVSAAAGACLFPLTSSVRSGRERRCKAELKVEGDGGSHACEYCRNFAWVRFSYSEVQINKSLFSKPFNSLPKKNVVITNWIIKEFVNLAEY